MRKLSQGSLVFRLWLAVSVIATVFTVIAFAAFAWLSIEDDIKDAHKETSGKVQAAALVTLSRFGTGATPTPREFVTAVSLGIATVEVLNSAGQVVTSVPLADAVQGPALPSELLDPAGVNFSRPVRLGDGTFEPSAISPLDVLLGGAYGEEYVTDLSGVSPDQQGYFRIVATYPNLTGEARVLVLRSFVAAAIIIGAILAIMWPLLNLTVARPLRRYSRLAMQIAAGEPVRMPAAVQRGELGELGRAVNSMADALEHRATVDTLTGLFNLRHLSDNLEAFIGEAVLRHQELSVIIGDLDHLKPVNDTYGHQMGDRVLRAVSDVMRAWAGDDACCWRLGGDEFLIALPGTGASEGLRRAAALQDVIATLVLPAGDAQVCVSISTGVSTYPEDGDTAGMLIGIADRRMYAGKATGRRDRPVAIGGAA